MKPTSKQSGFTLIELVTVILILGLLAVVAVPRFANKGSFESRTVEDKLISAARHAQQLAMSKAVSANVQLQTDNTNKRIRITYSEGGVQTIDQSIPSDVDIDNVTITFNKKGEASNLVSQLIINISPGSRSIMIETTGYTHAN